MKAFEKGDHNVEKGNFHAAIKEYNKAEELEMKASALFNNRAIAHSQLGEFDLALNDFNKAIELSPTSARAYYYRGLYYAALGKETLADQDRKKSCELGITNYDYIAAGKNFCP